jgi:DNA-binding response OmpR family regulator
MRTRVLVIAYDDGTRDGLASPLRSAGYATIEVPDGRAARAYIETDGPPALVILDLMLPGMDGWQFGRSWRHGPAGDGTPLLVLAAAGLLSAEDAPALGVDGILYRPIDPHAVRAAAAAGLLARGVRVAAPN